MNLKKIGKVFTSKFVGAGPSSYEKRIYRAAVSQSLRNTVIDNNAEAIYKRARPDIGLLRHRRRRIRRKINTIIRIHEEQEKMVISNH